MKEIWDLFDKDRSLLSQKQERNKPIEERCYHQVVSIWIKNDQGQYLMSKRHPKKNTPNYGSAQEDLLLVERLA